MWYKYAYGTEHIYVVHDQGSRGGSIPKHNSKSLKQPGNLGEQPMHKIFRIHFIKYRMLAKSVWSI